MIALRHTGIVVINLSESLHFYVEILGFVIANRADESGEFIDQILGIENCTVTTVKMNAPGGGMIELLRYAHPRIQELRSVDDIGISHIALTVQDLETMYSRLTGLGVEFISSPQISPNGYAKVAFCKDPAGNHLELVQVMK